MRIFSKDSSTPGALFRKAGRPPDRLSSSSFDTPSTWLSNLGSQHHKGYQGENSQHVGSSHDIARPLPDSQVTGKGFRRDADMPGKRGKEEQERHLRLMGKDGKAARAKDAEEMYGDRCRQNSPCRHFSTKWRFLRKLGGRSMSVSIKAVAPTLASTCAPAAPNMAHTSHGTLLTRPSIKSDAVPSAE